MKTLFTRSIFITIAVLSASAIFSPLHAQAVYNIQHYETANFTVDFMARPDVKAELIHDLAGDGTPFTAKIYMQTSLDEHFFLVVEQFDYDAARGEDVGNLDTALKGAYKSFTVLKDFPIVDCVLSKHAARERDAIVYLSADNKTPYLMYTRILIQGKRMWLLSVMQDKQSTLSQKEAVAFFDSFKLGE